MVDATRLILGLDEYRSALARQLVTLGEHHQQLGAAWHVLREVYAGSGAEVFAESWERADAGFRRYLSDGRTIQGLLERKLESLRNFDTPGDTGA